MIAWGGAMRWSESEKAWVGFIASLDTGQLLLRHELTFRGVAPDEAAAKIIAQHGADKLNTVAKCHFKNTAKAQALASRTG